MGFGEFLGNLAKGAIDNLQEKSARIKQYKARYERYDDKCLFRLYKSSSSMERKLAIALLLKERGYDNHNDD